MGKLDELLAKDDIFLPGHRACPGCGFALNMRHVAGLLGADTIWIIPAGCPTICAGRWPNSAYRTPVELELFASAAAYASGVKAGLRVLGRSDTQVAVWAGDASTCDIGFAAFSAAAERNEDILYFLNDNQAYMNTGNQRSGATPYGAWTTTTSQGSGINKKEIARIVAAHNIPYLAALAITPPTVTDFAQKVNRAAEQKGFRFLHVLSSCPPGWKFPIGLTVKITRLAVESRIFPLFECENGKWRITYRPRKVVPVAEYLKLQGRFARFTEQEIEMFQQSVNSRWEELERLQSSS